MPNSRVLSGFGDPQPVSLPVCDHYAGTEALLRKSLALQARLGPFFDITADCEEAAPDGRETEHAAMVGALIASPENRFDRVGIRIHAPAQRHWHSDLELVIRAAGSRLAYITVPKLDGLPSLERVVAAVDDIAQQCGVRREIPIHVLIETHGGLRDAGALAAHPRVECLSFGLIDYASGFAGVLAPDALRSPGQFEHPLLSHAKATVSGAAHAAGKVASHNVCIELGEPAAAGRDAARALALFGFTRMWSIHPAQIEPIVQALRPDATQIRQAIEALETGRAAGWQPVKRDGLLLDRASIRYWWAVLRRAHGGGADLPDEIRRIYFPDPTLHNPRTPR